LNCLYKGSSWSIRHRRKETMVLKCISVYWPYPYRPEGADCCGPSSCFSLRITKNHFDFRLSDISPSIDSLPIFRFLLCSMISRA
jgi:hypothetical protein